MYCTAAKNVEKTNSLKDSAIIWFRNNLRTQDNKTLVEASKHKQLIAVYTISPNLFKKNKYGFTKLGKYRAKFLLESLRDLKEQLKTYNISLICRVALPEQLLPELIEKHKINTLYLQEEWTQEEEDELTEVVKKAPEHLQIVQFKDQFLYHPNAIPFKDYAQIPEVFTNFRKKVEKYAQVNYLQATPKTLDKENLIITNTIPELGDLGFDEFETDPRSAFPFKGGSKNAHERLHYYLWDSNAIANYKETRNGLLGPDYSSKLSAWLANGSISAREVFWEVKKYEKERTKNQSTYWLIFELLWRDYFKYISLKHNNNIFQLSGILNRHYDWNRDKKTLDQWIGGCTKEPFVNANMKELAQTGFMSNRGRQNVASYWAKSLLQDWRYGAAYFEEMLIDYDIHSNWCNWLYVSGVGNDPRDRKFNIALQADRYDPKKEYQNQWI